MLAGICSIAAQAGNAGTPGLTLTADSPIHVGTGRQGHGPTALAVGDLDADRSDELVAVNSASSNAIVLRTEGDATLAPAAGSPFSLPIAPQQAELADINGDGHTDLISQSSERSALVIRHGAGDARLGRQQLVPLPARPVGFALDDLDGDGRTDALVATSDAIVTLLGNRQGGLSQAAILELDEAAQLADVSLGDLDGDGDLDAALIDAGNEALLRLRGDGQGGFAPFPEPVLGLPGRPRDHAQSDINGDGVSDIVIAVSDSRRLEVVLGNADAAAPTRQQVLLRSPARRILLGDVTGDSHEDLLVSASRGPRLSVLEGDGTGSFNDLAIDPVELPFEARTMVVGRFNEDLSLDLAVAGGESRVAVLTATGAGRFEPTAQRSVALRHEPKVTRITDVDGDGNPDVLVLSTGSRDVRLLRGDGDGRFTPEPEPVVDDLVAPREMAVRDLDADGNADIAITDVRTDRVRIWRGDGTGQFHADPDTTVTLDARPRQIALGDLDADAATDLVVARDAGLRLFSGDGSGGFAAMGTPLTPAAGLTRGAIIGDVNADGRADLLAVVHDTPSKDTQQPPQSGRLAVWLNEGDGEFTAAAGSGLVAGVNPQDPALGDVDGDGATDVVLASPRGGAVHVLLGDGAGGFEATESGVFDFASRPNRVAIADINGDGRSDLAVTQNPLSFNYDLIRRFKPANQRAYTLEVLTAGEGGLLANHRRRQWPLDPGPEGLTVSDVDGDDQPDVITANSLGDSISVLTHRDPTRLTPPGGLAGAWFDPDRAGEGLLLDVFADGGLFLAWFTYDDTGTPIWLTGQTREWQATPGRPVTLALRRWQGPRFTDFDPGDRESERWGEATLTLRGCQNAVMDFSRTQRPSRLEVATGRLELERVLPTSALAERCATAGADSVVLGVDGAGDDSAPPEPVLPPGLSGAWLDPTRVGEGVLIEVLGAQSLFMAWFTYDDAGNPVWLTAQTNDLPTQSMSPGTPVTMDARVWNGPRFWQFDPRDRVSQTWGEVTLRFETCTKAVLAYDTEQAFTASGELALTRAASGGLPGIDCELDE